MDVTPLESDDAETLALPDDAESEPDALSDARPEAPPLPESDTPTEMSLPLLCAGPVCCVGGDVPVPVVEACRRVMGAYGKKIMNISTKTPLNACELYEQSKH